MPLAPSRTPPAPAPPRDPPAPVLCTICGQRPRTILESTILRRRDLCQPCHRTAMLTFLRPPPTPPALCSGLDCPQHPGRRAILACPQQALPFSTLGYTADEAAAAGTLVYCTAPRCTWWAWEGWPIDPTLLPPRPPR